MKPQRGPGGNLDFAQRRVLLQHVHRAQLIEVQPHVRLQRSRQHLGAQINIFRPHQRPDPRPLVPLLNLAPPAVDLVAHHGRLFHEQRASGNQRQQRLFRSRHAGKKLPPWKNAQPARRRCLFRRGFVFRGFKLIWRRCRLSRPFTAASRCSVTGVSVSGSSSASSSPDCDRCVSGSNLRMVSISSPKELDAHRPVGFRRIHVHNSAAPRKLPRHLHQVHLGIAHAGQVRRQHLDVHLFAALERYRQARVILAVEELQRRRLHRRNQDVHPARRQLPQRRRALLLHVGVRREIFKRKHIVRRQAHHPRRIRPRRSARSPPSASAPAPRRPCCRPPPRSPAAAPPAPSAAGTGPAPSPSTRRHAAAPHPGSDAFVRAQIQASAPAPQRFRGQTGESSALSLAVERCAQPDSRNGLEAGLRPPSS